MVKAVYCLIPRLCNLPVLDMAIITSLLKLINVYMANCQTRCQTYHLYEL